MRRLRRLSGGSRAKLLDVIGNGTNVRKRGAFNAWYWAAPGLTFMGRPTSWTVDYATPESRQAWLAVADLRARHDEAALREFVTNDDLDLTTRDRRASSMGVRTGFR